MNTHVASIAVIAALVPGLQTMGCDSNPGRGTMTGNARIDADITMLQFVHAF